MATKKTRAELATDLSNLLAAGPPKVAKASLLPIMLNVVESVVTKLDDARTVVLSSDTVLSSIMLQPVAGASVALKQGKTYRGTIHLLCLTDSESGGVNLSLTGGDAEDVFFFGQWPSDIQVRSVHHRFAFGQAINAAPLLPDVMVDIVVEFTIRNLYEDFTLSLKAACGTPGSTVVVKPGTLITITELL